MRGLRSNRTPGAYSRFWWPGPGVCVFVAASREWRVAAAWTRFLRFVAFGFVTVGVCDLHHGERGAR